MKLTRPEFELLKDELNIRRASLIRELFKLRETKKDPNRRIEIEDTLNSLDTIETKIEMYVYNSM